MSKPHNVLDTSQTLGEEATGQATNPTTNPSPCQPLPAPALSVGVLNSEHFCSRLSQDFTRGWGVGGVLKLLTVRCFALAGGQWSQSSNQQVGTDRGSPLGLSSGIVPNHPTQANSTPPAPTPPWLGAQWPAELISAAAAPPSSL